MKNQITLFVFGLLTALPALAGQGDAIKVCGTIYESQGGVKGIADKSVMTSYELVISEVAAPKGQTLALINYESDAIRALHAGQSVCAIGVQGTSQDTNYPTINLVHWAIVSE